MATVLNQASAPPRRPGSYKVDISRGSRIGRVSSEWFSRPDDERYLSLRELHAATLARATRATTRTVETREVRVEASRDNAERLALFVPGRDEPVAPTHWSFGQLCSLVGAPSVWTRYAHGCSHRYCPKIVPDTLMTGRHRLRCCAGESPRHAPSERATGRHRARLCNPSARLFSAAGLRPALHREAK
ncbi:hypothetical protein [Sphingomonas hengshuiensis]|uniref:hypothetical protein n=1 Tax=Sphingomonas hengshuiensis TaxID=1609977 RepID=UPI000A88826F